MRLKLILVICFLLSYQLIEAQFCQRKVTLNLISVNIGPGCNYQEANGIDPAFDIFDLAGNSILSNEIENLSQVSSPQDSVPFSLSSNSDCCGNGYSPCLGIYDLSQDSVVYFVQIYDNDGACCNGYTPGGFFGTGDDNLGEGNFVFHFDEPNGTLDVGSCISFNYTLVVEPFGFITSALNEILCPGDTLFYNGMAFHEDEPTGRDTLFGQAAGGCDSVVVINTLYQTGPNIEFVLDTMVCPGDSSLVQLTESYDEYNWSNGDSSSEIYLSADTSVQLTITDQFGCKDTDSIQITSFDVIPAAILGDLQFCQSDSTSLSVAADYQIVNWSDASVEPVLVANDTGQYSVTVADANGCQQTIDFELAYFMQNLPEIFGSPFICDGNQSLLRTNLPFDSYLWSDNSTGDSLMVDIPGLYGLTVTDQNGCTATDEFEVSLYAPNSVSIIPNGLNCEGNIIDLNVSDAFASYDWSTGSSDPSIQVTTDDLYSVIVTDQNNCTAYAEYQVDFNPIPQFMIHRSDFLCPGGSIMLIASPNYDAYSWSTGEADQIINITDAGNYTVTVTDSNGCQNSETILIDVETPAPLIINQLNQACEGQSIQIEASGGFDSYEWTDGNTDQLREITTAGNYELTAIDAQGCSVQASIDISFFPLPEPSIISDDQICVDGTLVLELDQAYATYEWSDNSNQSTLEITNDGSYTVTVYDQNNCSATAEKTITFYPEPMVDIQLDGLLCPGENITLIGTAGFDAYEWQTGEMTETIQTIQPGLYQLTVTDTNGCQASTEFSFQYNPSPDPIIEGELNICEGDSTLLSLSLYPQVIWDSGNASITADELWANAPGLYVATVTDVNGCTASSSVVVQELILDPPEINGSTQICPNDSSLLVLDTNYEEVIWSTGEDTPLIYVSSVGNYEVSVTDINGCRSSTAIFIDEFNVFPPVVIGERTICPGESSSLSLDQNYDQVMWSDGSSSATISLGSGVDYTVTVTDVNGCLTTTSFSIDEFSVENTEEIFYTCEPADTNTISIPLINADGCNYFNIQYTRLDTTGLCLVGFNSLTTPQLCTNSMDGSVLIDIEAAYLPLIYSVFDNQNNEIAQGVINDLNEDIFIDQLSQGVYTILFQNDLGLNLEEEYIIDVLDQLNFSTTVDTTVLQGSEIELTIFGDASMIANNSWTAISSGELLCQNCISINTIINNSEVYEYSFTTPDGCFYTGLVDVKMLINDNIYIPNVISPNSQTGNDIFTVFGPSIELIEILSVYDRWGNQVYFQNNEITGWNGKIKDQDAATGVYVYYALVKLVDGTQRVLSGDFTLLR